MEEQGKEYQATLDEFVGIIAHDFSILASPGLALIGIDDEVSRAGIWGGAGRLVHEARRY